MAETNTPKPTDPVLSTNFRPPEGSAVLGGRIHHTEELGDGIFLEMVRVPGGTLMMGSPKGEGNNNSERPQHQVTIPPFFMSQYPITQAQWQAIATRLDLKVAYKLKLDSSRFKGSDRPVERINWYGAVEFCKRLSKLTGRDYQLPSEAEWEYACRARTTTPFSFGKTLTDKLANYYTNFTYADEPKGLYRGETTPVGSFPPNGFGLYDMHGNVWEWCADDWRDNYEGAPVDGRAWVENEQNHPVVRGGSWNSYMRNCRSAYRLPVIVGRVLVNLDVGFRVRCSTGI